MPRRERYGIRLMAPRGDAESADDFRSRPAPPVLRADRVIAASGCDSTDIGVTVTQSLVRATAGSMPSTQSAARGRYSRQ